jgi:hypothetical protein
MREWTFHSVPLPPVWVGYVKVCCTQPLSDRFRGMVEMLNCNQEAMLINQF